MNVLQQVFTIVGTEISGALYQISIDFKSTDIKIEPTFIKKLAFC